MLRNPLDLNMSYKAENFVKLVIRPKQINVVFLLSLLKKIGSVGRELFLFYQFFYNIYVEKQIRL